MSKPMTPEEARNVANGIAALCETDEGLDTPKGRIDLREVVKSLNEHADMLERQTVDREAVKRILYRLYGDACANEQALSTGAKINIPDIDGVAAAILALIPPSCASDSTVSEPQEDLSRTMLVPSEIIHAASALWDAVDEASIAHRVAEEHDRLGKAFGILEDMKPAPTGGE